MSAEESPGTRVELHDCREIVGVGSSIHSIKFPVFHMFDTNWKLKLCVDEDDVLHTNVVSLRMRHRRNSINDLWNIDATIRVQVDEEWLKSDTVVDTTFSHRKREIEINDIGTISEQLKTSDIRLSLSISMQMNSSTGIQLRNYIDFSRPLPIFSDSIVVIEGTKFHVNRMTLSMASPVFFQQFADSLDNEVTSLEVCNVSAHDFRRILNMIYPPHLPPKQWIKENDVKKQLDLIYHFLHIAKSLQLSIVFEVADRWLVKYGRFNLEDTLLLAQTFGLRELMGSKLAQIESIDALRRRRNQIELLSDKTKALILDHLLFSL